MYTLSFKPCTSGFGGHDGSAALTKNGDIIFAVEEERYTRIKHAPGTFPKNSIQACLEYEGINISEVDKVVLPYKPKLSNKIWEKDLKRRIRKSNSILGKINKVEGFFEDKILLQKESYRKPIENKLSEIGTPLPKIEEKSHHKCHAASAFYPTDFDKAIIITADGFGEYDSTVVWEGDQTGVKRHATFEYPNSLGHFYSAVTEFLGYRANNGEGKVMGLAPYGSQNEHIEDSLRRIIDTSADYDVTEITGGIGYGTKRLETIFNRSSKESPENFNDWEKDLAYVTQSILEEIMMNLVRKYTQKLNNNTVCLAGGIALNCKMNNVIEQSNFVDELFVQPVAHDAGLALGGCYLTSTPAETSVLDNVYWGSEYENAGIKEILEECKLEYGKSDDISQKVAKYLADGNIVGWFQGRSELGPRALGNRSILADPRSIESRDRVNKFVKHREVWRPFAPSIKQEAIDDYLVNPSQSPFMINTYKVREDKQDEIPAVLHPADGTTRPQTVNKKQNPRYYDLLSEFENLTGVPVLLNTSFNDHSEPIVNHPTQAIKDFYGMGLDILVLEDYILEK